MGVIGQEKEAKLYLQMVAFYRGDKGKFGGSIGGDWSQALCNDRTDQRN